MQYNLFLLVILVSSTDKCCLHIYVYIAWQKKCAYWRTHEISEQSTNKKLVFYFMQNAAGEQLGHIAFIVTNVNFITWICLSGDQKLDVQNVAAHLIYWSTVQITTKIWQPCLKRILKIVIFCYKNNINPEDHFHIDAACFRVSKIGF